MLNVLFIEHSMRYFHLLLICKNNKTAICCRKTQSAHKLFRMSGLHSLRNWVCNSRRTASGVLGESMNPPCITTDFGIKPHSPCWLMGSLISSILLSILHTLQHLAEDKASENQKNDQQSRLKCDVSKKTWLCDITRCFYRRAREVMG